MMLLFWRLTSAFKEDHDVRLTTGNLFEVQRNDITVQFEGLGNGDVHFSVTHVAGVKRYPVVHPHSLC